MKKQVLITLLVIMMGNIIAQDPTPPTNIINLELRTWLRNNWYNGYHSSLGYSSARQEMYSYIDNEGGQVYCVYSGFHQAASFTSYLNPINAEHTIPQSFFGQAEPMRSDIHHLFPTHQDVNTARSNLPFDEINDSSTDKWFIGNDNGLNQQTSTPSINIDLYSELNTNVSFEPREDHKGNVARAIFYFYTMYPTQAGNMSDVAEIETLCAWHLADPVDAQENTRNNKTQENQGNYNPFINLPDLAQQAWGCSYTGVQEIISDHDIITISPNPASSAIQLSIKQDIAYSIFSSSGKLCQKGETKNGKINIETFNSGVYFLHINNMEGLKFIVD